MSVTQHNYEQAAAKVEQALRSLFGSNVAIEMSKGHQGRVRVKLVSEKLNDKTEKEKQDMIWKVLRKALKAEAQNVAYVLGYGMDEL